MKKLINLFSKTNLPYLILFSALFISITGSFFSIYGLGKLFGGHQVGATILAFAFEFGNIITASSLKIYWKFLSPYLKWPFVGVVVVLTTLTSMGIYGYLSDGYQKTALKDEVVTKRSNLVKTKKEIFVQRLDENKKEIGTINSNLQELSKGYNQNTQTQQVIKGQVVTNVIVGNKKGLEQQMNILNLRKSKLDSLNTNFLDSIQRLEFQIIEIENGNEVASELGPLKYLSNLTGKPMNIIVNWLILMIVIVFQPLALMLILTSMFAFKNNHYVTRKSKPKKPQISPTNNDPDVVNTDIPVEEKITPKRKYNRKTKSNQNDVPIEELPIENEIDLPLPNAEIEVPETVKQNPKPRKGKRRIIDTNLTPDIATHIAETLQQKKQKMSPSQIKISPHQDLEK